MRVRCPVVFARSNDEHLSLQPVAVAISHFVSRSLLLLLLRLRLLLLLLLPLMLLMLLLLLLLLLLMLLMLLLLMLLLQQSSLTTLLLLVLSSPPLLLLLPLQLVGLVADASSARVISWKLHYTPNTSIHRPYTQAVLPHCEYTC